MPHPVIESDRTRLRPTGEADLDLLAGWFGDPGMYERWGGAALGREEVAAKYLGARSPEVECFVVEEGGTPVGFVQYWPADVGVEGGGLDMVILPAHRRLGVGRRASRLLARYLRAELGWQRITVDPDRSNPDGVAFWTAVGFVARRLVDDENGREPYWLMELEG